MLRSSGPGQVLGSYVANWVLALRLVQWLGWVFETQERKKERPGPDGPRASGWYGQLRVPISLFLVLNSDQIWQLFSLAWTIFLPMVIYNLDSGIPAKNSKQQTSFYSMQVSFCFHSLRCSEILVSPSICTQIRRPGIPTLWDRLGQVGLGQVPSWV